jgi:hypothetical protein
MKPGRLLSNWPGEHPQIADSMMTESKGFELSVSVVKLPDDFEM